MTAPTQPRLVRALGRWTMVGLVINSVIGSAAFGLPDDLVRFVGNSAPWAYVLAAAGIALFMGVFAELGSQFSEAGGPYLFAREGCGRFWGIQMGWFIWLVRLTSAAANANLFVVYLGEFWPGATATGPRLALLVLAGFLWTGTPVTQPPVAATAAGWMNAVLALLFAFGGFEAALMPLAE